MTYLKWTLIALAVSLAFAGVYLTIRWLRNRKSNAKGAKFIDTAAIQTRLRRNAAFNAGLKRLDGTGTGWDQRYRVPWCLVVGESGVGRTSLLSSIELHRPFGSPDPDPTVLGECAFWFFDRGLVLDVPVSLSPKEEDWVGVLYSVRKARRQRPIDSVVLTIAATDLTGPSKLDAAALKAKGEGLYQVVRRLQEELGVLFPIYVVVTKIDLVPGFAESCRALPVTAWEEMFGWSSSHSFETPYSSEWVEEAFDSVNSHLQQTQMDLLAASPAELRDPEAVYTLPAEFAAIQSPLQSLLDQVFTPTSYHEAFSLRGLYFVGDPNKTASETEGSESAVVPADLVPSAHRPIFTTHLFESKIFPERGLARPAARSKAGNRRSIIAMQVMVGLVALTSPLCIWSGAASMNKKVPPINDSAVIIGRQLQEITALKESSVNKSAEVVELKRKASDTLQAVSRIHAEHIWQFQFPTSWFSDIDVVLRTALQRTFEDGVLFAYFESMQEKRGSLLGDDKVAASGVRPRLVAPANVIEFQALKNVDLELQQFSNYVAKYNEMAKLSPSKKLDVVNELAKYLLSLNLGPVFMEHAEVYQDSLVNVNYTQFDQIAGSRVQEAAEKLAQGTSKQVFQENAVETDLKELAGLLGEMESSNADADTLVGLFRRISETIGRTKSDLASPEMAWLGGEELGEPFVGLLGSLRNSPALSKAVTQSFDDRWHSEYKEMRRRLVTYSTATTGPILGAPSNGKLVLSEKVLALEESLNTFLAQSFVRLERTDAVAALPPVGDVRILWSGDSLEKAIKLAEPYDAYIHQKLDGAPESMRSLLEQVAKEELELGVKYLVQKAQRTLVSSGGARDAETAARSEMSAELSSLKRVVTQLRGLLETAERLELASAGSELRRQVAAQTQGLLRRVDSLLEQAELYTPDAKLEQWQGVRPPALEAFDLAGADALGQYLRTQRGRIADLSRDYAGVPVQLLDVVSTGSGAPALLGKWQRISAELTAREAMAPGNSVQGLEQFIQVDMVDLTRDNCLGRLPKRSGEGSDYFASKLSTLRNILRRRCEALNGVKLLKKYDVMASTFNETLAGRFPFALDEAETQEGDASPHDISKFLREYDAYMPEFENYKAQSDKAVSNGAWGPFSKDMIQFLEQMRDVRRFFQPLMAQDGVDVTPRYGLRMVPRVNRTREFRANQIIQWDMLLSGQRVDQKQALWSLGDPVRMVFRWAKDAPFMPSRDGQAKIIQVSDDDSVAFDFGGSWSLLRLLRAQQAPTGDLDGGVDARPHTLEFVVRVEERPTGDEAFGVEPVREKARAFVRLSLTGPDGVARLVAPKFWPIKAPQMISVGNESKKGAGSAPAEEDDEESRPVSGTGSKGEGQ